MFATAVKLIRALPADPTEYRSGAVAIGNFDGVHRGHMRIMERLVALAARVGGPSVVFTFDPHPVRLLRPEAAPPPITWTDRKAELLSDLGIDAMIAYPTNHQLLDLSPAEFYQQVIRDTLDAKALAEGPNFCFGKDRAGTIEDLRAMTNESNIVLEVVEPLVLDGQYVSSSRIRRLIAEGEVSEAAQWLTQPYRVRGIVTHGVGRGSRLGFPTANIEGIDTLMPATGVYAGRVRLADRWHAAAIHIGPNPTFDERIMKFEVHVMDFSGTLYGELLEVDMLDRIRDIQTFDSSDGLVQQIRRDQDLVRKVFDGQA